MQKLKGNDQEKDPAPDEWAKLETTILMGGEKWEVIQENRKWENKDGC